MTADAQTPPPEPLPDFEAALADLERLVERLERGEQSLEEALADYEQGVRLARTCQQALARAELRLRELSEELPADDQAGPPAENP